MDYLSILNLGHVSSKTVRAGVLHCSEKNLYYSPTSPDLNFQIFVKTAIITDHFYSGL